VKSLATDLALEELSCLLAFFYRRVGNRPDARDLTQQVAMRRPPAPLRRQQVGHGSQRSVSRARSALADFWHLRLSRPLDELRVNIGAATLPAVAPEIPSPVSEISRVYACDRDDVATIKRLVALRALPSDWRSYFEKRLAALNSPAPLRS
jgi:hypothetical protein